jgi:purine-binding chemotaxis protein CheW
MSDMTSKGKTYLSFYMGDELFGANVVYILEVLKGEHITEIPRSEDFIEGIINFRGEIVTVIDFKSKLNLPETNKKDQEIIIVVELLNDDKNVKVGLLADKVRKVFDMADADLKPVPEFGQYYNPEYLNGVAKTSDGLVMIIDIEKVLNDKDVQILKNVTKENI